MAAAPELIDALRHVITKHDEIVRDEYEGTSMLPGMLAQVDAARELLKRLGK